VVDRASNVFGRGTMLWYVGQLVEAGAYTNAAVTLGALLVCGKLISGVFCKIMYHMVYMPYVVNLIRRQLYHYMLGQSLAFFQNDFAGRIANKVMEVPSHLRDALHGSTSAVWFCLIFASTGLVLMFNAHPLLFVVLVVWLVLYISILSLFIPKVQKLSGDVFEYRSSLTGQVVDSFVNFLPIKFFAHEDTEDQKFVDYAKIY
jgi:ATP-binding cassette subfamily B multidrug efflux pump